MVNLIFPAFVVLALCFVGSTAGDMVSLRFNTFPTTLEEPNIESMATTRVQPAYPPMAQKYKIEGTVVVEVSVTKDGKVNKAEFIRGHSVFRLVSLDAAKQWEFRSFDDDSLRGTINFSFKLNN